MLNRNEKRKLSDIELAKVAGGYELNAGDELLEITKCEKCGQQTLLKVLHYASDYTITSSYNLCTNCNFYEEFIRKKVPGDR